MKISKILQEIVDIAVGWFMESGDTPDVRKIIGNHLISWALFWKVTFILLNCKVLPLKIHLIINDHFFYFKFCRKKTYF